MRPHTPPRTAKRASLCLGVVLALLAGCPTEGEGDRVSLSAPWDDVPVHTRPLLSFEDNCETGQVAYGFAFCLKDRVTEVIEVTSSDPDGLKVLEATTRGVKLHVLQAGAYTLDAKFTAEDSLGVARAQRVSITINAVTPDMVKVERFVCTNYPLRPVADNLNLHDLDASPRTPDRTLHLAGRPIPLHIEAWHNGASLTLADPDLTALLSLPEGATFEATLDERGRVKPAFNYRDEVAADLWLTLPGSGGDTFEVKTLTGQTITLETVAPAAVDRLTFVLYYDYDYASDTLTLYRDAKLYAQPMRGEELICTFLQDPARWSLASDNEASCVPDTPHKTYENGVKDGHLTYTFLDDEAQPETRTCTLTATYTPEGAAARTVSTTVTFK